MQFLECINTRYNFGRPTYVNSREFTPLRYWLTTNFSPEVFRRTEGTRGPYEAGGNYSGHAAIWASDAIWPWMYGWISNVLGGQKDTPMEFPDSAGVLASSAAPNGTSYEFLQGPGTRNEDGTESFTRHDYLKVEIPQDIFDSDVYNAGGLYFYSASGEHGGYTPLFWVFEYLVPPDERVIHSGPGFTPEDNPLAYAYHFFPMGVYRPQNVSVWPQAGTRSTSLRANLRSDSWRPLEDVSIQHSTISWPAYSRASVDLWQFDWDDGNDVEERAPALATNVNLSTGEAVLRTDFPANVNQYNPPTDPDFIGSYYEGWNFAVRDPIPRTLDDIGPNAWVRYRTSLGFWSQKTPIRGTFSPGRLVSGLHDPSGVCLLARMQASSANNYSGTSSGKYLLIHTHDGKRYEQRATLSDYQSPWLVERPGQPGKYLLAQHKQLKVVRLLASNDWGRAWNIMSEPWDANTLDAVATGTVGGAMISARVNKTSKVVEIKVSRDGGAKWSGALSPGGDGKSLAIWRAQNGSSRVFVSNVGAASTWTKYTDDLGRSWHDLPAST